MLCGGVSGLGAFTLINSLFQKNWIEKRTADASSCEFRLITDSGARDVVHARGDGPLFRAMDHVRDLTIHPRGAERGADPDTAVHHHARLDLDAAPRF